MNVTTHDSHATLLYFLLSILTEEGGDDISQVAYRRVRDKETGKEEWIVSIL